MGNRGEALRRTEEEIRGEKAATLGRAGERLEAALAAAAEIRLALDAAVEPAARERLRADYEAARKRALDARRVLLIQREAIGLRNHRVVDLRYPEPPKVPPTPQA
ncbi:MAG TPA: hypothetical protein VML54_08385 [Candidatus Limnocylindrales bacterium]|nr:hypothetical protein [Candidatus Limnocylindrales bacterium]